MEAHTGSLRSSNVCPKSVTTYSSRASRAKANEAVSRKLSIVICSDYVAEELPKVRTTAVRPIRYILNEMSACGILIFETQVAILTKDLKGAESFPQFRKYMYACKIVIP